MLAVAGAHQLQLVFLDSQPRPLQLKEQHHVPRGVHSFWFWHHTTVPPAQVSSIAMTVFRIHSASGLLKEPSVYAGVATVLLLGIQIDVQLHVTCERDALHVWGTLDDVHGVERRRAAFSSLRTLLLSCMVAVVNGLMKTMEAPKERHFQEHSVQIAQHLKNVLAACRSWGAVGVEMTTIPTMGFVWREISLDLTWAPVQNAYASNFLHWGVPEKRHGLTPSAPM